MLCIPSHICRSIHSLRGGSAFLAATSTLSTHQSEVRSLSYGRSPSQHNGQESSADESHTDDDSFLLASASRDRSINVHKTSASSYRLLTSIVTHSAAVTAVAFASAATGSSSSSSSSVSSRLVSCGADRGVVFRAVCAADDADDSNRTVQMHDNKHDDEEGVSRADALFPPLLTHAVTGRAVSALCIHPTNKFAVTCGAEKQMQVCRVIFGPALKYGECACMVLSH